jgi:hypothetical protein
VGVFCLFARSVVSCHCNAFRHWFTLAFTLKHGVLLLTLYGRRKKEARKAKTDSAKARKLVRLGVIASTHLT